MIIWLVGRNGFIYHQPIDLVKQFSPFSIINWNWCCCVSRVERIKHLKESSWSISAPSSADIEEHQQQGGRVCAWQPPRAADQRARQPEPQMFIRYLDNAVDNVVDNIYGPLLNQGTGDHVYVDLVPQPRPQSRRGAGVQTLGCVPYAEPFAVWENQNS